MRVLIWMVLLIWSAGALARGQQAPPKPVPPPKPGEAQPRTHPPPVEPRSSAAREAPITPPPARFDASTLDTHVDPCVNFYQYACGPWMARHPIPPDQSRWGTFDVLAERNREILRQILEQAASPSPQRDSIERQIGDYYAACMDVKSIDRKGVAGLRPELDRIAALTDRSGLASELVRLHRSGVSALFEFGSGQDFKNSSQVIAQADQGGLGLPDRDYYLKTDAKSVELREKYVAHVQRMFELLGRSPARAKAAAAQVFDIETALAKGSLDLVSRRDPEKIYHKLSKQQLVEMSPSFAWPKYLEGIGAPPFETLNVAAPEFFKTMGTLLEKIPLAHWKTYLTWHLVHSRAVLLPTPYVEENFSFYGRTLTGAKELRPRWKRCVDLTDAQLGEALGRKYVERAFGGNAKERTLKMVEAIEAALRQDIQKLDWMSPATKKQALEKLRAITNKIGYPDRWRDYSSVHIARDDALGNAARADAFEFKRQLDKIGKPVDRKEWNMTPHTVNAYYDPLMNNINFPAGILQPPFYDQRLDDGVNFGGIGAVIGHELTHGFDDEGRQFDAQGNLRDWWTAQDAKEFQRRAGCFVEEYGSFGVDGGVKLNGKLTLGENTADNGGVRLAYMALAGRLAGKTPGKIDGLTPEQRLFLGWAQIWCQSQTEESARMLAAVDPHSPGKYRVNGVLQNMPEFQKSFGCRAGQPMISPRACHVW